jgi:DNA modification methylase
MNKAAFGHGLKPWEEGFSTMKTGVARCTDVISVPVSLVKGSRGHPAAYPVELPYHIILTSTEVGDTVLDPFCGSGSTGVACIRTGRKFIGIEQKEEYFEAAFYRLKEAVAAQSGVKETSKVCIVGALDGVIDVWPE